MSKAGSLREERYAGTWIYRIMINTAKDYMKKYERECELSEDIVADNQENGADMDLKAAVDKLPVQEKTLIILRYYEDKPLSDIAEIMQENLSTIKSRLYRTLKKLREELSALENKEGPDSVPGYLRIQEEAGGGSKGKALGGRLRYWDGREECENE